MVCVEAFSSRGLCIKAEVCYVVDMKCLCSAHTDSLILLTRAGLKLTLIMLDCNSPNISRSED